MRRAAGARGSLIAATLVLVVVGGVLIALLTDGPPAAPEASASNSVATDQITISDFKFKPADVTVPAGTQLTFVDEDTSNHNATARDGSFETGNIDGGKTGSVTLEEPGTYDFYCTLHPFMTGTVTVTK